MVTVLVELCCSAQQGCWSEWQQMEVDFHQLLCDTFRAVAE
jgi:hypothetical protein